MCKGLQKGLTKHYLSQQASVAAAASDCEVGAGKKACKNCTCGRADAEAAVQKVDLTADMLDNPQSACGSVSAYSLVASALQLHHCLPATSLLASHIIAGP